MCYCLDPAGSVCRDKGGVGGEWTMDFAKSVSEAWVRTYPQNHVTWLNLAYVTWHASSFLPYHTHLTYLTSTSPRIREIRTTVASNGRSACSRTSVICPRRLRTRPLLACLVRSGPVLNSKVFDRRAAYRFSLAFQRVVNIGVRDSEPIRSRVVQAGTLGVVGFILEAWLASKVFAVGSGVGQVARSGGRSRM